MKMFVWHISVGEYRCYALVVVAENLDEAKKLAGEKAKQEAENSIAYEGWANVYDKIDDDPEILEIPNGTIVYTGE